jgi:hypothetical protein
MPKSSFAPAIADVGRYPAFSETDLRSISYANAFRLYPELAKRIGNDVRDHAHLNARRATQGKYE